MREKPSDGSSLAFPSNRIPKATKNINAHFFIHSFTLRSELIIIPTNSCKLYSEFRKLFGATTYDISEWILFRSFRVGNLEG
jgi:hypothetical protein